MRINRFIATSGVSSRRKADELIVAGRVTINGEVVKSLGTIVDPIKDEVRVDGEKITPSKSKTYVVFHKPKGVISSMSDPFGRSNLNDYFRDKKARIFHVGRLDKDSEGLLLLTDDGDLAHKATHPSFGLKKRYLVLIKDQIPVEAIKLIKQGVKLEDGIVRVDSVKSVGREKLGDWVEIELHEGRNQVIRRVMAKLDLQVLRLVRIKFGPIELGDMKAGRFRVLNQQELLNLFNALSLN
jgi:23S rRNA pseudouridine2605 synthase